MQKEFKNCQVCGKKILSSQNTGETICNDCDIWAYELTEKLNWVTKESLIYLKKLFKDVNNQLEIVNLCRVTCEVNKPNTNLKLNSIIRLHYILTKANSYIDGLMKG